MGNLKITYKPSRSIPVEPVEGDRFDDPQRLFSYVFGAGYEDLKPKYDQLPADQKQKICELFGGNDQFMETGNNGYNWTNNKIQDEEEEEM